MIKSKVHAGQCFLDKVVEMTGSIENAFDVSLINGLSMTDDVEPGQIIQAEKISNASIASRFNDLNRPATNYTADEENYELPGEFPLSF